MIETILNVLMILMGISGPTPVAGFPGGTTAAFLAQPDHGAVRARLK